MASKVLTTSALDFLPRVIARGMRDGGESGAPPGEPGHCPALVVLRFGDTGSFDGDTGSGEGPRPGERRREKDVPQGEQLVCVISSRPRAWLG